MSRMAAKNAPFSPAVIDLGLGLGDDLKAQLEEQRKKKLLAQQRGEGNTAGYGPATMSLFADAGGYGQ